MDTEKTGRSAILAAGERRGKLVDSGLRPPEGIGLSIEIRSISEGRANSVMAVAYASGYFLAIA